MIFRDIAEEDHMVTFEVESKDNTKVVYRYYPENHLDRPFGIIDLDLENGDIYIVKAADEDYIFCISAEEQNSMRDTINEMRKETGMPPLTEEELPTATKDEEWYYYAEHAIRRIREELEKGSAPENGVVIWY